MRSSLRRDAFVCAIVASFILFVYLFVRLLAETTIACVEIDALGITEILCTIEYKMLWWVMRNGSKESFLSHLYGWFMYEKMNPFGVKKRKKYALCWQKRNKNVFFFSRKVWQTSCRFRMWLLDIFIKQLIINTWLCYFLTTNWYQKEFWEKMNLSFFPPR